MAENYVLVYEHGSEIFRGALTTAQAQAVLDQLSLHPELNVVVCGLKSAWYLDKAIPTFVKLISRHYHRLQPVKHYRDINDTLFKFSLNLSDEAIPQLIEAIHATLDGIVKPITSGFGFVDLIIPSLHKASGLNSLFDRWGISPDTCVAIGDSPNDLEMLRLVKWSFAMGNAVPSVREVARFLTDANNNEGALNVI